MPEGHTIHRLARRHTALLVGRTVSATSPQGRFAAGAQVLGGRPVHRAEAYGKHLFYIFEGDVLLHVHLGLYGAWTAGSGPAPRPRGALRLRLVAGEHWLDLRGPTACELYTPADRDAVVARLGPDPLRPDADPRLAWVRVERSRTAVGALLMDQSVLCGVGNVYRAEVFYRAGLSPFRPGREVPEPTWDGIWADLRVLLRAGVRAGHIVTTAREEDAAQRAAAGRGPLLRLPPYGTALPAVRHAGAYRGDGGAQPVLVPGMSARRRDGSCAVA